MFIAFIAGQDSDADRKNGSESRKNNVQAGAETWLVC